MSATQTCDVCGSPDAKRVEIGVSIDGAVPGTVRTGHTEALDVCDSCRSSTVPRLAEHVWSQLEEQIPLHVQRHDTRAQVEQAAAAVAATASLAASGGGFEALPEDKRHLHLANVKALSDLQDQERALVTSANATSAAKITEFRATLG